MLTVACRRSKSFSRQIQKNSKEVLFACDGSINRWMDQKTFFPRFFPPLRNTLQKTTKLPKTLPESLYICRRAYAYAALPTDAKVAYVRNLHTRQRRRRQIWKIAILPAKLWWWWHLPAGCTVCSIHSMGR